MQKFFFILTTILTSILGIYIYVGATFDLYNLQYPSQILIGVFLLLGGISQLIGGPKPHLSILFIFFGVFIIFLYFIV
ncbi:hypothetical protein BUY89_13595 [Staphylococcus equorum]|nr:hypothetical protein BUY85_12770 [Staphylococcus equorum]PTE89965.1 hypothetical protein BUY89_13595 [Staphylococcus equorum]